MFLLAAENNPLHDYPEEEDSGDPSEEESDKTHDSGASDEDYDQNNFQWSRRLWSLIIWFFCVLTWQLNSLTLFRIHKHEAFKQILPPFWAMSPAY